MWNRKMEQVIEVLNDLTKVNSERLLIYRQIKDELNDYDSDFKNIISETITETEFNIQQLSKTIMQYGQHPVKGTTTFGQIYRAWKDLKRNFTGITTRSLMATFQYNEEITKYTYLAALNSLKNTSSDVSATIESQIEKLRSTNVRVKKSREKRHFSNASLMYLS